MYTIYYIHAQCGNTPPFIVLASSPAYFNTCARHMRADGHSHPTLTAALAHVTDVHAQRHGPTSLTPQTRAHTFKCRFRVFVSAACTAARKCSSNRAPTSARPISPGAAGPRPRTPSSSLPESKSASPMCRGGDTLTARERAPRDERRIPGGNGGNGADVVGAAAPPVRDGGRPESSMSVAGALRRRWSVTLHVRAAVSQPVHN